MHAIETIIQRYCPKIISFIGEKRKRNLFKRKDHRVEEKFCFISTRIEKKIHENLMYPISDSVKETKRNLGRELAQLENLSRNPVKGIFTNLEDARIPTLQKKDPRFERKLSATRKSSIMYSYKALEGSKRFPPFEKPCRSTIHGRKKFHVWLRKGRRRSFEKKVRTQRSTISYLRQRIEKGQEDFLLPFPFFEQSYWISRLQNVTKCFP